MTSRLTGRQPAIPVPVTILWTSPQPDWEMMAQTLGKPLGKPGWATATGGLYANFNFIHRHIKINCFYSTLATLASICSALNANIRIYFPLYVSWGATCHAGPVSNPLSMSHCGNYSPNFLYGHCSILIFYFKGLKRKCFYQRFCIFIDCICTGNWSVSISLFL